VADPLRSLKLTDFEDTEFLLRLEDLSDDEGWTTTADLAEGLGLTSERPTRNVGSRLGWLKKYGVVVSAEEGKRGRWKLSEVGRDLVYGKLTAPQVRALASLSNGRLLAATRSLSSELSKTSYEASSLMHRQWRYGLAQREP
jgi:hypothetical protein